MKRIAQLILAMAACLTGIVGTGSPASARTTTAGGAPTPAVNRAVHACGAPVAGRLACLAQFRSAMAAARAGVPRPDSASVEPAAVSLPGAGYGPADIRSLYGLDTSRGAGQTVAIVDAFDNPRAEADLAAYRAAWKLPPCTTANGCFRKLNQRGTRTPPAGDPGWGVEIALDLDAASAACPRCHLLLVEADSPTMVDLGTAVNRAVTAGARIVSNSYGGPEFNGVTTAATRYYTHPGTALVVSSGDAGFGPASFPAAAPHAIAVGGTRATRTATGWAQSAWSGAGSGCSAWFAKPTWQHDPHCAKRTVADVSALADPQTGLAVYDTYDLPQAFGVPNGWVVVGGTSLAAPLVAGMIGIAGNPAALPSAQYIYSHAGGLIDVIGGSTGSCGGDYLCTALRGYDGPTGRGTPRGVGAL